MDRSPDILIGCYHKTGTFVLGRLARRLARELGGTFINMSDRSVQSDGVRSDQERREIEATLAASGRKVIFDWASSFALVDATRDCVGFRVVRDPRDVVISSANYHGWSDEASLHVPRPEFGGLTYQQKIRELDLADSIHFEIDNKAGGVVRSMLAFDRRPTIATFSYESLIAKRDSSVVHSVATHLGIPAPTFAHIFVASTKTEVARDRPRTAGIRSHIQDGRARQWIHLLDPAHLEHLNDVLPDCAERLGYEPSALNALRPDRVQRLRYSSLFWANRGRFDRAIDDAKELARIDETEQSKDWLAVLRTRQPA